MARVELFCQGYTREYRIDRELLIGRGESCDIKVPSIKASRNHCRIFKAIGGYFLEDLGSANGTLHNGILIGRKLLKHNDEIEVGRIKLRFIDKTEDPLIGRRLGHYQIIEKIGGGAEGVIYHGRQVALKQEVALKLLREEFVRRMGGIESLRKTFERALDFSAENVVRIHEFGEDKGRVFLVMDLVSGENLLGRLIRKQRLKVSEVVKYGLSICQALMRLHDYGVLHGDIKPHNIIIMPDNTLKLVDLSWRELNASESEEDKPGAVAAVSGEELEEETEESRGNEEKVFATPQYAAPELIKHQPPGKASDIYALSVTLYQLLTGSLPYNSEHIEELLKQHLQGDVTDPRELNSRIPQALAELILAGMKPDISERIGNALEYKERLETLGASMEKKRRQKRQVVLKRLGKRRLGSFWSGMVYKLLIGLVFVLLAGSYGVRKYREYALQRDVKQEEQLKSGNELYVQGEYEKAAGILNALLAESPTEEVALEAQKTIGLLQLPDVVKELQVLKKSLQSGEITRSKAISRLRERLRSGKLSDNERKEYLAYLKSIGGDTDVRYSWQKEADKLLAKDDLRGVMSLLSALSGEKFGEYELAEYNKYMAQIREELATEITEKYDYAGELLKAGRIVQARALLTEIVNKYPSALGWQERVLTYFAQSNEALIQQMGESFSNILKAVGELNESEIREEVFRFQEYAARHAGVVDIAALVKVPALITAFEAGVMQRIAGIQSRTGRAVSLEVMLDGRVEMLEVSVQNKKLLASVRGGDFTLGIREILPSSIEKIMPVFEISPAQAAGAGLYFIARGDVSTGRGYLQSLSSGGRSDFSGVAAEYLQFLAGRVALPVAVVEINKSLVLAPSSTRLAGCSILLPVATGEYVFQTAEHGRFVIRVQESRLVLEFDADGKRDVLGEVVIQSQERGSIEIKGYWDRIIISQNDIMVGSVTREALGSTVFAPALDNADRIGLYKSIVVDWPSAESQKVENNVLGLG